MKSVSLRLGLNNRGIFRVNEYREKFGALGSQMSSLFFLQFGLTWGDELRFW